MKKLTWLGCLGVLVVSPAFAQSRALAEAERAYQGVDFPATHLLAEHVLETGGASRAQTARLYVLLGISAAALGDADEAKQDFVVALAIDPALKLDKGLSPKIRGPYLEAHGYWSASSEELSLAAKQGSDPAHLIVHLSDPASLVAKVELRIAAPGVSARPQFELQPAPATSFTLPDPLRERGYEYTLRALDRYGNALAEQGTDADPVLVRAPHMPKRTTTNTQATLHARSYLLPATLGLSGLGALAVGAIFQLKREQAARAWNGPNCENQGQTRLQQCQSVDARRQSNEHLAIGFYAGGGALLTGSIIALVAGRPNETASARAGLSGCALSGAGFSCDGRF